MELQEISITELDGVRIGHAQDIAGATGCTVILCPGGAPAGIDVRGGGPASRETELLRPVAAAEAIHAVLLSGGSAFGLDAAGGVMRYLAERGCGLDTGYRRVPLVCQSCLYDLGVGSADAFPDANMAYRACIASESSSAPEEGNAGAGVGATVGKLGGAATMMKSGLGIWVVRLDELIVGAVAAVNALGDVFDAQSGRKLAGMLTPDLRELADTEEALYQSYAERGNLFAGNTTLVTVLTNAKFDKTALTKIAAMAQNGLARAICPVHTTADGDTVYALSTGSLSADINVVGTLAARVTERAIARAVLVASPAYGLRAACDFL